jgi:hypothetical protein
MWGELWRIEALIEGGQLDAAAERLGALRVAVERVGGPLSAWHLDRVTACIAQAQGRYADAAAAGRRAFDRMRPVEPAPAAGSYFGLQRALARHVGVTEEALAFAQRPFGGPPRFITMGWIVRALLLLLPGSPTRPPPPTSRRARQRAGHCPRSISCRATLRVLSCVASSAGSTSSPNCSTGSNRFAASTAPAMGLSTWVRSSSPSAAARLPSAVWTMPPRISRSPPSRPLGPAHPASPPKLSTTSRWR